MLFLFFTVLAQASEMKCVAPFDDSSYYELNVKIADGKIQNPVAFAYVTNDGLDLKAKLKPSKQKVEAGKMFSFEGSSGSMSVKAGADFWAPDNNYQGAIEVSFAFDGTPPVAAIMTCREKP